MKANYFQMMSGIKKNRAPKLDQCTSPQFLLKTGFDVDSTSQEDILFYFLKIEFITVTLVNNITEISGVRHYNATSE